MTKTFLARARTGPKTWVLVAAVAVLLGSVSSSAEAAADRGFAGTLTVDDTELARNGVGLCEWGVFSIDLYRAALYLERTTSDAREVIESQQVKRVELIFERGLSQSQMRKAYRAAYEANSGAKASEIEARVQDFCSLLRAVEAGERLAITVLPGEGTRLEIGGEVLGTIRGEDFARATMALYVGVHPPSAELKRGLLGEQ